tara:strand:- start:131 stop:1057 length:927 start_codon:yes stop_codon:yes gene_type:complete
MKEGLNDCNESETINSGYVKGNEAKFLHYDQSEDSYYELEPNFSSWSGLFGDSPQDTLTFKYFDESLNRTYTINEKIPFTPDMTEGNAIEPFEFTYDLSVYQEGPTNCNLNINDYEHNGSITSSLSGIELGDQFSSYVNNECRGTIEAMDAPFGSTVFFLLSYGNTALTLIDSFDQTLTQYKNEFEISEFRNSELFNVYREGELIEEELSEFYYIDESVLNEGEYCYEIALTDNNGIELINSMLQCIEIKSDTIIGDVDQSGDVNVVDIVMLVNLILNGIQDLNGDADQNGSVNVADIVFIVNIILNQ